ncbi:trans-aconitate 2-methyltransferase [Rhizobium sp. YIM 134829]|uniref:trans-aconitate 2-methyltransferase n=1 Tax=Rhizobium sp. YIM 134829 TaxID=3390453 RepID=UPI00397B8BD7
MAWSAADYLTFEAERTRPALDLAAQIPSLPDGTLYDLGCGPGNSTAVLAARFPGRRIIGVDSDADMLDNARRRLPQTPFLTGDLADWQPEEPAALFFANAVFQWLPEHPAILERLLETLVPGGVLAVQMPDNLDEPSHIAMRVLAADPAFRSAYPSGPPVRTPIDPPRAYVERLSPLAQAIDVWRTSYHHRLADAAAIVEWVKGTGLRPFLAPLSPAAREAYLAAYLVRIAAAYPPLETGGILLPFPRLFLLAIRR